MLYLWHVTQIYGILQIVYQQLTIENSVNDIPVPSISSSQKQKASSDESEINEKLGIEFEMLYWQCCKLEKVSQSLDDSIIDYELNLVEDELLSNCLSISERALHKKQTGMTQKEELSKIVKILQEKEHKKSQLQNIFNIVDEGDIFSVTESVKASGCTTPITQCYLFSLSYDIVHFVQQHV